MIPYWSGDGVTLYHGDVLEVLAQLPAESVSCVVTSPPFWGLRKYDCPPSIWGGSPDCDHRLEAAPPIAESLVSAKSTLEGGKRAGILGGYSGRRKWQHDGVSRQETPEAWVDERRSAQRLRNAEGNYINGPPPTLLNPDQGATCARCGAWRGWLGLEPTVAMYIEHTMMWLRAVRRVMRKDGVLCLDIDDSRSSGSSGQNFDSDAGSTAGGRRPGGKKEGGAGFGHISTKPKDLPPKNLCLIPQRIAIAAQEDSWIVRSEIIIPTWMPESATDRPTDACRKVLMLCKSPRYWYDAQAVRVIAQTEPHSPGNRNVAGERFDGYRLTDPDLPPFSPDGLRNLGSVWDDIPPSSSTAPGKHFATFPVEEPLRCIRASCPAEVCRTCGKARVRIVKTKERQLKREPAHQPGGTPTKVDSTGWVSPDPVTVGWTSCVCGERDGYEPGWVLDPFCGTSTTLVAARQLGRRAIGIDLSEEYLRQAVRRLQVGDAGVRQLITAEKDGAQQATLDFLAFPEPAPPDVGPGR